MTLGEGRARSAAHPHFFRAGAALVRSLKEKPARFGLIAIDRRKLQTASPPLLELHLASRFGPRYSRRKFAPAIAGIHVRRGRFTYSRNRWRSIRAGPILPYWSWPAPPSQECSSSEYHTKPWFRLLSSMHQPVTSPSRLLVDGPSSLVVPMLMDEQRSPARRPGTMRRSCIS